MKSLIVIYFLFITALATAQTVTLSGQVKAADREDYVPFATLATYHAGTIISGSIADEQGKFSFSTPSNFDSLQVSFIGYRTRILIRNELTKLTDLSISLSPNVNLLEEVTVTGQRTLTEQRIDRKVINLGADLQQAGASALEAMDQLTEIQIDLSTGNISLRGSGDVRLFVNGKPSGLSHSELLQQIPSSTIDYFEIITAPSASEQANGIAGILNVVLKKDALKGLNLKLNSGYGNYRYNYGFNGNYSHKWLNLRLNVNQEHQDRVSEQTLYRQYSDNRTENIFTPHVFKGKLTRLTAGIDLFPNDQNQFSIDWEYTNDFHSFSNDSEYTNVTGSEDFNLYRYSEHNHFINTLNANYRHQFNKESHTLEIDYNLNVIDNFFPANEARDGIFVLEEQYQYDNQLQFLGIDYQLPLSENTSFETGLAWNNRVLQSDYNFADTELTNINCFDYEEDVLAGYAQMRWVMNRFKVQAGLRYEHFRSASESTTAPMATQKQFNNLFPSLHLSYSLSENQQLNAGYSKRIARPNFNHLNPFQLGNPYFRFVGNPELAPELADNIELGYQYTGDRLSLSLSTFYRHRKSVILLQSTFNEGFHVVSYTNGGINQSTGIEGNFSFALASVWDISLAANYYHTCIDESQLVTWDQVYSSSLQLKNTIHITSAFVIDLSFRHDPKRQQPFRFYQPRNRLDLAMRATLLDKKLSLNLRVIDLLNDNLQKRNTITPGGNQLETWRFATQTRGFLLSAAFTLFENTSLKRTRKKRDYQHGGAID